MSLYLGENLISGQATLVGESRNIGQIIQSTIPLTDAGLHLLDGSLIQGNGIYSAFVDYIASIYDPTANYFCTESEWQTAVTAYGVCGKFVYDSVNNTVRLPKYNSKIYTGGGTAPVVGNGMTLGLTDGTNYAGLRGNFNLTRNALDFSASGYGKNVGDSDNQTGTGLVDDKIYGLTTDPTKSGLVAQLSNITTSLDGYYYIVIATSTKTDIQVDIDEIATDLNGKADTDLSNVPASKGILTESYVNGTSWYRVYSDGWCEQGGQSTASTVVRTVNFVKPFVDTNYYASATKYGDYRGTNAIVSMIATKSANSMEINNAGTDYPTCMWEAKGYIN